MAIEDPQTLLGRLKLGREEYCQRLLTMLILDGPYPRWNTPSAPSDKGQQFLSQLDELSFGESSTWSQPVFIDELDLPKRTEWEPGGAPDMSLRDAKRLWLIELKTEAGSHRAAQLPMYFDLARHHFPGHRVDITYLTGPLSKPPPSVPEGSRYGHLTWAEVLPLVREIWGRSGYPHDAVTEVLTDVLDELSTSWTDWRAGRLDLPPTATSGPLDWTAQALEAAKLTAADRAQRVVDLAAASLEDLQAQRLETLQAIGTTNDPELAHVRPWLWRWQSGGQPLTSGGLDSGYELRLSWYANPV